MKSLWLALLAFGAATAAHADAPVPSPAASDETIWYAVIGHDGAQIGGANERITIGPEGRAVVAFQEMDASDPHSPTMHLSWRTERRQDAAGRMVFMSSDVQTGKAATHSEAHIDGNVAAITRRTQSETRHATVALPAGVRFDSGDDLLPGWNPAQTPKLEFDNFDLDAQSVEHIVIEPLSKLAVAPGQIAAVRKHYQNGALIAVVRLIVDAKGRIVESRQPMFDTTLAIRMTDRATSIATHPPYSMLPTLMRKSPYRIGSGSLNAHIRYRFAFKDGIEFALPATGEQSVTAEPGHASIDICANCGPGLASDPASLAAATKPSPWLQSDNPRIKALVDPIAHLDISDTEKMDRLRVLARRVLAKVDFVGYFSALDAVNRRAGDCTEAAVVLAAFGRAAGIPTRVANGLVYSQVKYHGVSNAFLPHSWVLAYTDGRWRSFDAALDTFDSTHIAVTVGDGDEKSMAAAGQLASLLEWQSMAEVRSAASN